MPKIAVLAALLFIPLSAAHSQARPAAATPPPRDTAVYEVRRLRFDGNALLTDRELANSIHTEATRCKSWAVWIACQVSSGTLFETRHDLDLVELGRDIVRIRVQYWLRGYRDANVDTVVSRRGNQRADVTFRITEGEPLRIARLDARVPPTAVPANRVASLLGAVQETRPFDLIALDTARLRLRGALWEQGHSDAIITVDTMRVSSGMNLSIDVNPRWQSRVGRIQVTGNSKIGAQTIRNSMYLKTGQIYRYSDMSRSQRALYESGLFARATIEAVGLAAPDDSLKLFIVDVTEAKLRQARIGVGVSTVDFFQVEGQFTNFNWGGGARRVTLTASLGNLLAPQLNGKAFFQNALEGIDAGGQTFLSPTWRAGAELRIPWIWSPRNEISLSAFAQRRSLPGIFVDRSIGFSSVFTRELADRVPMSLGYQFELTRVDAGDLYFCVNFGLCDVATVGSLRQTRSMSPLTLTAAVDRTDDPLAPKRGHTARLSLEHASQLTFSDYRYNRAVFEASLLQPAMWNTTLGLHFHTGWVGALRGGAGSVATDAAGRSVIHPRKRFFAGGAQSVRGYGEGQLGPRILTVPRSDLVDAGCSVEPDLAVCDEAILNDRILIPDSSFTARPLGGNLLIEGTAELRFPLWRDFSAAVFLDGALVGESGLSGIRQSTTAVTPGFGIRFASIAGPIRMDLGYNPHLTEELPVVTEVLENGRNRIATLQMNRLSDGTLVPARRLFTPQRSKGLLGFLSLFTLHLSIGEAF